jgi:hypothetical protein
MDVRYTIHYAINADECTDVKLIQYKIENLYVKNSSYGGGRKSL